MRLIAQETQLENRTRVRSSAAFREQGMALVMSLMILFVLTILGVTAMSTATLQEKMSGNTQEQTRAFEAAESGLKATFTTAGVFDLNTANTSTLTYGNATAVVATSFRQTTSPPRGSGYSSTSCSAANFDQRSSATTGTGASTVINRGVGQIMC